MKKVIPSLLAVCVFLIFQILSIHPLPDPLFRIPLPINQTSDICDAGSADCTCTDIARPTYGFPFRINGYDDCGDGGIVFIALVVNLAIQTILALSLYSLGKYWLR